MRRPQPARTADKARRGTSQRCGRVFGPKVASRKVGLDEAADRAEALKFAWRRHGSICCRKHACRQVKEAADELIEFVLRNSIKLAYRARAAVLRTETAGRSFRKTCPWRVAGEASSRDACPRGTHNVNAVAAPSPPAYSR